MDRYSSFKAVSQTLHAYSQNIPFPGGLALESTARLILVVTAFMEMKETEKQDRQRSKRLLQRGVDISHLILRHDQELRRDQASSSFIVRFMSTIAAIDAFVSEISRSALARKGIRRYLTVAWIAANGNESRKVSKQQFDDYSRELDSLHLDFQSHLSSVRAARGPHQLIKHPDVQLFWKYRLTNALEVPWNHFWCHFLDEYLVLKRTFLGQEGQKMKHIFEKLANSSKIEGVSPQELDQIFQPRNESVDRIVDAFLQNELGSNEPTDCQDIASLGEVQQWKGYWVRDSYKGIMNLEICVSKKHQVFGSGVDEIERFTLEGKDSTTTIYWKKQYINGYIVIYEGSKLNGSKIQGVWSIINHNNILKGQFFLEKVQVNNCLYEPPNVQTWNGFCVQNAHTYEMNTFLVFTYTNKIHGGGFDTFGPYTWFGTFEMKGGVREVVLTKQYYQAHSMHYHGMVTKAASKDIVMKGIWSISDICKGEFELRAKR